MSGYRHPHVVRKLLYSLIPIACPDRGSGLDDDLIAHSERTLGGAPRHIRLALTAGVATYDLAAIAYPGVAMRPAHLLSEGEHRRYFEAWWHSPLVVQRELVKALKGFLGLAYYEHPEVQRRLGYTPDAWIEVVKARRLRTYSAAIAEREQAILAPDPLPTGFFDNAVPAEVERAS